MQFFLDVSSDTFISCCFDAIESNDQDIIKLIAAKCPEKLVLDNIVFTSSSAFALGFILEKVEKHIKVLSMENCGLDYEMFAILKQKLDNMKSDTVS